MPAPKIKRVYELASKTDGTRILVDRLWPRGLSRQRAAIDLWLKEIAPSTALRQWFAHSPSRWVGFQARYRTELTANLKAVAELRTLARGSVVTLLYGARDPTRNNAVTLLAYLRSPRNARR